MARNVEWKARARDPQHQRVLAEQLASSPAELLEQVDTFFHAPKGRLKLRRLSAHRGELIAYHRPDQPGPKPSTYSLLRVSEPDALRDLLGQALGVLGEVRKKRWLYLVGQTRIHLDEVEGLGTFLEVEVGRRPGQDAAEGERIADEFKHRLDVRSEELISGAYIDLMGSRASSGG